MPANERHKINAAGGTIGAGEYRWWSRTVGLAAAHSSVLTGDLAVRIRAWHVLIFGFGLFLSSPAPHWMADALWPSSSTLRHPASREPRAASTGHEPAGPQASAVESVKEFILVLLEKAGEAFMIAAVLALFVDESVKHHLVQEIVRDVLDFTVGFQLPLEVKEQVHRNLRLPFVRREYEVRYTLEPQPADHAHPPRIRLHSQARFRVINLTDSVKPYEFTSSIEKGTDPAFEPNQIVAMEVPALGIALRGAALTPHRRDSDNFVKTCVIVHVAGDGTEQLLFQTERVAYHRENDTVVLDILEPPCIGVTLIVDAPEAFAVTASFGQQDVAPKRDGRVRTWVHPAVHLPGSHLRFTWRKVSPPSAAGSPAAAAVVGSPSDPSDPGHAG